MNKADLTYEHDIKITGNIVVIGAKNPFTGIVDAFCLPRHEEFPEWSKNFKAQGFELLEMTIEEVCDYTKNLHMKMQ